MEFDGRNHFPACSIKKDCDYWHDYTKFAVVRNPWEAELSFFFYRMSQQHIFNIDDDAAELANRQARHIKFARGGFPESLKNPIRAWDWYGKYKKHQPKIKKNPKLLLHYKYSHEATKYPDSIMRFLTSNVGSNKLLVDNILRFENLEEDLEKFCNKYDLDFRTDRLEKRNTTHHLHYSRYYNPSLKRFVERNNFDYIKYFGYEFEKVDE